MNFLRRFFAMGRFAAKPKDALLAPASVQRAHLALRDVNLPAGVIKRHDGVVCAALSVNGWPLHVASPDEARLRMLAIARTCNTLPRCVSFVVRSRPGLTDAYLEERREQATALALREPGSAGSGLARLAADQFRHLVAQARAGTFRETAEYVLIHNRGGDVGQLERDTQTAATKLSEAGLRVSRVTGQALATALAASWHPQSIVHFTKGWNDARGEEQWVLHLTPGNARVERAKPAQSGRAPGLPWEARYPGRYALPQFDAIARLEKGR